jgi:hypothetical protein
MMRIWTFPTCSLLIYRMPSLLQCFVQVLELRQVVAQYEEGKEAMQKEMASAQENYMKTIQLLQQGARETSDSHKEYLGKITKFIESSNESRKTETTRFAKELETGKHSRDAMIHALEQETQDLRSQIADYELSRAAVAAEDVPDEIHKLARKLERLFSSEHILSVIEAANRRPDKKVSSVETGISSKCRRTLYRLEDLVVSTVTRDDRGIKSPGGDCEAEAIGLQNQLVRAYEDIEQLQEEIAVHKSVRSEPRRKSPLRSYFKRV